MSDGSVGYVFVDESGTHTEDDCYVVAGCCCISESRDATHVLRSTRDSVADDVMYRDGDSSRELKGSAVGDRRLDSTFVYLRNVLRDGAGDDATLDTGSVPWTRANPIRFCLHDTSSVTARRVLENYVAATHSHRPVQILSLVSILNPILWFEYDRETRIEEYRVVLDAPHWKDAVRKTRAAIEPVGWLPRIEFQFRDSRAVPGIQLADVAAYSRRKYLMSGTCDRAAGVLDAWRL